MPGVGGKMNAYQRVAIMQAGRALARTGGRLPASMGELKNKDSVLTFPAFATGTASITLLNGLQQGTTATTRLGRRIVMKSVYLFGQCQLAPTSTGSVTVRVVVVYDKQANATAPTAADLWGADGINNMNNLSNSRRFVTIIEDIRNLGTAGPQATFYQKYKKLNLPVEFNAGSAGTIGDIQTGSLYAFVVTTNALGVASLTTAVQVRVRYSDQ